MSDHYDPDLNERKYRPTPPGPAGLPGSAEAPITGEPATQKEATSPLARNDVEIAKDVERSLFYDNLVNSIGIQIDCNQGIVTLSGAVDDDTERRRAIADASRVAGVKQVVDHLELAKQAAG